MAIVQQLSALRKNARLPATRVADVIGTGVSNIYAIEHGRRNPVATTLERIAEACGGRILAVQTDGAALVSESAELLRQRVESGNAAGAYRQLIQISDDLARATPTVSVLLTYIEPPTVSPGWDAAIAAVVEWHLTQKSAPLPLWTEHYGTSNTERWEPLVAPYDLDPGQIPEPLRRRNVWIEESELRSV